MIFLDTITANPDRHTSNFGLLRDADTGELLGLAPLFDHNMALISRGYPKPFDSHRKDLLITLFQEVLAEHPAYRTYLPAVTETMLQEAAAAVNIRVRKKETIAYVWERYRAL